MSTTYSLFGKQFTPSEGLSNYNVIRQEVLVRVDGYSADFRATIENADNVEALIDDTERAYVILMDKVAESCVNFLNKNNIFDLDKDQLLKIHAKNYTSEFDEAHDSLMERYEAIIENEADKDAYRTARRQGRSRWVGFTDEAHANARLGNAAMGALHGTANIIGKIGSSIGATVKKSAIFKDLDLRKSLADGALNDAVRIHFTLADHVQSKGWKIAAPTSENHRKADYMFDKLDENTDPNHALDTTIEILELDPYKTSVYAYLVNKFGDKNCEVKTLATVFGCGQNLEDYKLALVEKCYESLPKATLEDAKNSKVQLTAFCESLGTAAVDCCNKMDGVVLECKGKCALEICDSMPKSTEEEALAVKEAIITFCQNEEISEDIPAMAKINTVLAQIDLDIRTVEGIEFETREIASQAKLDTAAIEEILTSTPLIFRGDFMEVSTKIQGGSFNEKIEALYLKRINETLTEFDKKLNLSKNYAHKKTNNKKFSGGFKNLFSDVKSMLGSTKEEDTWKELTHDGELSLDDVGSDQISPSSLSLTGYPLKREAIIKKVVADQICSSVVKSVSKVDSAPVPAAPPTVTVSDTIGSLSCRDEGESMGQVDSPPLVAPATPPPVMVKDAIDSLSSRNEDKNVGQADSPLSATALPVAPVPPASAPIVPPTVPATAATPPATANVLDSNVHKVGQNVFARWDNSEFYFPGIVSSVNGNHLDISFLDGDEGTVSIADVLELNEAFSILKLQGNWDYGDEWYSGKISKTKPLTMQYDDGEVEEVELIQLRGVR